MKKRNVQIGVHLRVVIKPRVAMGPGKADILKGIRETGSITSAGRRINMSYKRAWQLVNALNQDFETPLVTTSKGGRSGGGAALTPLGEKVLSLYQRMVTRTEKAVARDLADLEKVVTG